MKSFKSFFRALFFGDASLLVKEGKRKILFEDDLLPMPEWLNPRHSPLDVSEIRWESGKALAWSLLKTCRRGLSKAYAAYGLAVVVGLLQPLLVNKFVGSISAGFGDSANFRFAMVCALLLGISAVVRGVSFQHFFFQTLKQYQLIVNIINERLFRHSLRMTQQARMKIPVGDVVNHMGSDSETVADFSMVFADLIFTTLTVVSVVGMLFHYIGWSAVLPLILLACLAPATRLLAKRFSHLDEIMMKERDHRVTLMGQILNAIRVVKYFAWEKSVSREVRDVRHRELQARRRMARSESFAGVAYVAVSSIVLFVALAIHVLRGFSLDPALVFTLVALFGLLEEPFGGLSWLLSRTTNAFVSARRISEFLKSDVLNEIEKAPESDETAVSLRTEGLETFGGLEVSVRAGESIAIVGPVGCGKSTLLMTLIGESAADRGRRRFLDSRGFLVEPRTAYVPQEAFIVNGTLRENLLFGGVAPEPGDVERALHLADFEKDLALLPAGLQTEIGEKGVNLSGGQKQRVSLARAILKRPQIVFLDDPLSAVDVETEQNLSDRLLFGAWKDVTRVVATHRLEHLANFDRILFMENGRVVAEGTLAEVEKVSVRFRSFLREHSLAQGKAEQTALTEKKTDEAVAKTEAGAGSLDRITEDEDREVGAVKGSVYLDYFKSLGGEGRWRSWRLAGLLGGAVLVMALPLLQRWWLGMISSYQQSGEASGWVAWLIERGWSDVMNNPLHSIAVYGLIGLSALLFNLMNSLWWLERGIGAGKLMQERMLSSLLKAPLRFFDSTPVGRILQRFSRDVESVDIYLQRSFSEAIHIFIEVILCLVLILTLVPVSFALIGPILILYYIIQKDYRMPAREVKRLDSIARSPRYAHFKETLVGLPVIRGFQSEDWFLESFYSKLGHSQRMFYNHVMLNRWFSVRVPLVGGLIAAATSIAIVLGAKSGHLGAGIAGVLTIYMLNFWAYLNWGIRVFADIESRMTSVERMKFYTNLPSEVDTRIPRTKELPESWPFHGEIVFENVQARYAPHLPRVLHGVSFKVGSGEKVGLIGRTGSGKSTLFQCLFRFVELESGRILIDGEDIASVPLERLRRSLAIIPQDPTLFLGTIRSNMDRYNEYSEEELEEALRNASLLGFVKSLEGGLDAPVLESGLNLSQGQRQLLCLARALLTKARIIVLDEATASVDVETDAILQKVIRENLRGVTLLIIAHRLGTVADCDKVVDLAFGRVKGEMRSEEARRVLAEIVREEET